MTVSEIAPQMAMDLIEEGFTEKNETYDEFVEHVVSCLSNSINGTILWPYQKREDFDNEEDYIFAEPIGEAFNYNLYECEALAYLNALIGGDIEERIVIGSIMSSTVMCFEPVCRSFANEYRVYTPALTLPSWLLSNESSEGIIR